MNFSKEEIALCKKIAEKHRKKIKFGDWIYSLYGKPEIMLYDKSLIENDYLNFAKEKNIIPLWQISDCLELMESKGWRRIIIDKDGKGAGVKVYHDRGFTPPHIQNGDSLLEAYLKAVLAVMEES